MKRKKVRGAVFLLVLLLFCGAALWFFWSELMSRLGWREKGLGPAPARSTADEKIFEEDRRKLNELLKKRQP